MEHNNKAAKRSHGVAILAPWNKSIALQVLVPVILIGVLALSSMLVSVWVTLDAQYDAEAINLAGSMRMQSYRIATQLQGVQSAALSTSEAQRLVEAEVAAMDRKLYQSSIAEVVSKQARLQPAYQRVVKLWRQQERPMIVALQTEAYLRSVGDFVDAIDKLVSAIQYDNEAKNSLLRVYQAISIALSVIALLLVGWRTDRNVVSPLKDLVKAAKLVEKGDFSYRSYYRGHDEVGLVCQTFNELSEKLARSWAELEGRVEERTGQLLLSNLRLDFLYNSARRLSDHSHLDTDVLTALLADLRAVVGVVDIRLYRSQEPNGRLLYGLDGHAASAEALSRGLRFELEDQGDHMGSLLLMLDDGQALSEWQQRLVETMVELLSSALALQYRETTHQRLMLFEERSVIARELHDSLAQSLSYMKFQTERLSRLAQKQASEQLIQQAIDDIQDGLNTAYKHLRELLTTFRMKVNAPTLQQALHAVVEEFKKYPACDGVRFELNFNMAYSPLTPNEDIHVLQVMREALNNAIKHAGAAVITIASCERADKYLEFSVSDDGVGMAEVVEKTGHYGLQTMRERADLLNAELELASSPQQGTRVLLRFVPLMWQQPGDRG